MGLLEGWAIMRCDSEVEASNFAQEVLGFEQKGWKESPDYWRQMVRDSNRYAAKTDVRGASPLYGNKVRLSQSGRL